MIQFGKFVHGEALDWDQTPSHGYFDINGLHNQPQGNLLLSYPYSVILEAHVHGSGVWLDLILEDNLENNCKSFIQCPYPGT